MKRLKPVLILFLLMNFVHSSSGQTELWGMAWRGGEQFGCIYTIPPGDTIESRNYSFEGTYGSMPAYTKLIQATNGKLYGLTFGGGSGYGGILFEYDPVSSFYIKRFDFSYFEMGRFPSGSLVEAPNGKLYGLLSDGGANLSGALFEYDPVTFSCVSKIDFSSSINGAFPCGSMIVASNGLLYGMTKEGGIYNGGVIFEYDPLTNVLTNKADLGNTLQGYYPWGDLVQASNGKFYGMTSDGGVNSDGVIFEFDLTTSTVTTKFDFNEVGLSSGRIPYGSLMQASDGNLYGMTSEGGVMNTGTLFQYNILTSTFTKKIDFDPDSAATPKSSLMQATNGKLYGMSSYGGSVGSGAIFTYDIGTGVLNNLTSLIGPNGGDGKSTLLQTVDGKFYGLTTAGGKVSEGILFEFDTLTNSIQPKVDFGYAPNGREPRGRLVKASNGKLYGMTIAGGANDLGVIFEYDQLTGIYTKKFDFDNASGHQPEGTLLSASNGKLYGLTEYGGTFFKGTLFEFDPVSSVFIKHFDFDGVNGAYPRDPLMEASNGKLYGLTGMGGSLGCDCGVLFEFDPVTNVYTKKLNQSAASGGGASAKMVQAINGKLYGVAGGGVSGDGTIFEYDIPTNTYVKKKDFTFSTTGNDPMGDLIIGANGNLYGVTHWGGAYSIGTLFEFNYTTNVLTKHIDLNYTDAGSPYSGLVLAANGKMYAVADIGADQMNGVLYEFDPLSNVLTTKMKFLGDNGLSPISSLIELPCLPAVLTLQPISDTICEGDNAGFSVSTNEQGYSFQWQVNYGSGFLDLVEVPPYSHVTSSNLIIINASDTLNNYSYQCVVTNPGGCVNVSNPATLTVNMLPVLTISTANDTVCFSSSPVLISTSPSGGTLAGTAMVGSYFIPANAGYGQHIITYNYTDSLGCSNSITQTIFVDICLEVGDSQNTINLVNIFPNPTTGKFTIVQNGSTSPVSIIKINNIIGDQVFNEEVVFNASGKSNELDLSFLPPGLYFVKIVADKNSTTVKLMIH